MRNLKRLLLVLAITLTCNNYSLAQTQWTHYSEWMANTQKSYVYQKSSGKDYWRYDDGLMYESILDTYEHYKDGGSDIGDATLKDAVKFYIDKCIDSNGNLLDKYEDNTLDDIRPARMVYKYYKLYGGSNLLTACQTVMNCAAFSDNYRVINHSTGYPWQHKSSYAHQVWLDGIFMGLPYWTLAGPDGVHSSHHTSWTANDYFDDAYNQMQITDEKTYEPEIRLWCHAWDEYFESTTNTPQYWSMKNGKFTTGTFKDYHTTYEKTKHEGRSSHCWGRAAGWFAMAIMETMDNITAVDASYAHLTDLQTLFQKVIDAVWEKRDPTTGMWRCVLDVDDSTGDYKAIKEATGRENYLEATCSAMFTYCLLHGVAKGYLPSSYLDKAKSSYQGLINTFITTDGGLKLNNCMEVGGLGGTTEIDNTDYDRDGSFAYYTIEKKKANDSKGVGPFIWASLEAEKIGYNMETNSFGPIDENTIVTFAWSKASDEITQGASYTSPTFTARSYGNDTPLTNSSEIVFESNAPSVATVAADGTVTPVGIGTATITASLKEGSTYIWSGTNPTYTITVNAPDTTAPTLEGQSITNGTTNVSTSGSIVLTFNEDVACTTNATLTPAGGGTTINLTPTVSGSTVTYSYSGLSNETSYTFNLAANSVADTSGNNYANAVTFSFTTKAAATETTLTFFDGTNSSATVPGALNDVTTGFSCTPYNLKTSIQDCEYQLGSTQYYKSIKMGGGAASGPKNLISFTVPEGYTCDMYMVYLETSTGAAIGVGTSIVKPTTSNSSSFDVWHTAIAEPNSLYSTTQSDLAAGTYYICPSGDVIQVAHLEFTLTPTSPTPTTFTLTNTVNTSGYGTVSPPSVASIPSGTATTSSSNTYTVNGTTVTATPTEATAEYTYAFSGWSGLPATVTANATVRANFTRTAKEYTLAWNSNGGSALSGDYTSGTIAFGTAITAPNNPTRDGYTFNGWNTDDDGSGTPLGSTMPAANTTYYAQWTKSATPTPSPTGDILFSQDFNSATAVDFATSRAVNYNTTNTLTNCVGSGKDLFTSITCDAKNSCGLGINSSTGGNSKDYTGKFGAYYNNTGGYWSIAKTTNFATTAPSAIKVEMNASFAAVSQGSNIGVQLAVGSGFNDGLTNSCPALSSCVAGFALPSSGAIRVAKYVTSNGITSINNTSSTLTDGSSYKYTWVINNTNETLTYEGPDGNNTTVDAKCWDLWIDTSKNLAGITQTTTGMSGTSLQNLYIGSPFGKKHEFIMNDIKVYDLTPTEVAKVATPEITPDDGTVFEGTTQNVSISCSTSGASIYYTLDGTDPTTSSIPYNSAFTIYGTKIVKAIAAKSEMTNSEIATATITNTCLNEYSAGGSGNTGVIKRSIKSENNNTTTGIYNTPLGSITVSNSASLTGGYEDNNKEYMKYGGNNGTNTWTLTLPEGVTASSITFTGRTNATSGDKTTITNVDGETLGEAYTFNYSGESDSEHTYNFATPQNEITFVVSGYQLLLTITLTAPVSDGTLLLKQNATEYTPVAASGVTVTLERSLQANKWNPMCLPFDITPSMFSQTTQIETLQKVSNGVFTFAPTNSVPAGTPFIAKPAANIANPVFEDVEVKAVDAGSDIKDGYTFQGNYTKVTLDPETNLFISMSQQKLVSPTGSNILQGLRGYFIVPTGEGARFSLNFDGEMIVTDINRLNIEHLPFAIDDNTPIYNLSGQRVSKDYKGIVIINGKKFVRK